MATGEIRGCLSLSEPDAGSDTSALRCQAVRDGDEYVDRRHEDVGHERRARRARRARGPHRRGHHLLHRREGAGPEQIGGITVSRNIGKLGYKGIETVEMVYDGHRVPADAVLGGDAGLGRGQHFILSRARGRAASTSPPASVGVGPGRVRRRHRATPRSAQTFGKPIAEHQAIQIKLADMATQARRPPAC